jgi:hypothetical protein
MKRIFKRLSLSIIILFTLLFACPQFVLHAQNTDTLSIVKELNEKGKYIQSEYLLRQYYKNHPGDLNTQWIYAQSLYYSKKFKDAQKVYEDAIAWHPENYTLRLDYAQKLVEIGEIQKAEPILKLYLAYDSLATGALLPLAKIEYWKGNFQKSLTTLDKILKLNPNDAKAKELKTKVVLASSPWVNISTSLASDDQPVKQFSPSIELGRNFNRFKNLSAKLEAPFFFKSSERYTAQMITVSNVVNFFQKGIEIRTGAGFAHLTDNRISVLAKIFLKKRLNKDLSVSFKAEHIPYLYNRENMDNSLMFIHYYVETELNRLKNWQFNANLDVNHFYSDNNLIYNLGAWILSPELSFSKASIRLGYGFRYSASRENRFVSQYSTNEIEAGNKLSGVYSPYFTPENQIIHSAILSVNYSASKNITLGVNASLPIYCTNDNPYLYLSQNALNNTFIVKDFTNVNYYPVDINAFVSNRLSRKMALRVEYAFMRTSYYSSHYIGVSLKLNLLNE